MGAFLLTILIIAALMVAGVAISVYLFASGGIGGGRFRRVRRVRKLTPLPGGTVLEETIEETVEEVPAEVEEA
jgi:hypothetical protein